MGESVRSFRLAQCDWIGFDLDHTIVRYNTSTLDPLVMRSLAMYMVEHAGFDASLLEEVQGRSEFLVSFACKGLVIDVRRGNMLQLHADKSVCRAFHGTSSLSDETIAKVYGSKPITFEGVTTEHFVGLGTAFERPCGPVFALLVDRVDAGMERRLSYEEIRGHLMDAIYFNYARYDDSFFFKEMRANIGKYVFKRPKLKEWILTLRRSGINVFLLTNSMLPYTHLLSRYVFGDDWVSVYDLCLFYGRKPHFFLASDPFKEVQFADDGVSDVVVRENVTSLEKGKLYTNGNHVSLTEYLERNRPEHRRNQTLEICYVGDHIMSDITVPKSAVGWHTIAVVEELEAFHDRHKNVELHEHGHELHLEHNEFWGSYFSSPEQRPTFWQRQLQLYATLCVPCLSHFFGDSPDTPYESPHMEHVMHPAVVLQKPVPSYTLYYRAPRDQAQ